MQALRIEPGRPGDDAVVAGLIAETSPGLFAHFCGGDLQTWIELAAAEWRAEHGVYSHSMGRLARHDTGVLGLSIGYPVERRASIDWSFAAARAELTPQRWAAIAAAMAPAVFLSPWLPPDAWYVQNIVVAASARGKGHQVGAQLMADALAQARAAGCASVHLDVAAANPAVAFYERQGFRTLVRTEVPALPDTAVYVRMARAL